MVTLDPSFHMWVTFAIILAAIVSYALDRVALEMTSLATLVTLLVFFNLFPLTGSDGHMALTSRDLLAGFADPALVAILSLMVMGQGIVQTGALDNTIKRVVDLGAASPVLMTAVALLIVALLSGMLNNTPIVVIFIPIMAAFAKRAQLSPSRVMMPLSFAAVLGGNLTLIGSSTNLLAAGAYKSHTDNTIGFFDFTIAGAMMAAVGLAYVIFIAPRLLQDRAGLRATVAGGGRQFIVQLEVTPGSTLDGQTAKAGLFPGLKDMTVRMIVRREEALLPPFDDLSLKPGDQLIVAATRQALTDLLKASPGLLKGASEQGTAHAGDDEPKALPDVADRVMAEVVVAPASRMVGRSLSQIGFYAQTGCVVLGIQRRSRMIRQSMNTIRLEAGDTLLVMGSRADVKNLRSNRDVLLLEWSAEDMPTSHQEWIATGIFLGIVGVAATGVLPIAIAALTGATLLLAVGCLNIRQAARAVDQRIVLIVAAALAMGRAMEATGGAQFLTHSMLGLLQGSGPLVVISAFFLMVALMTNILSNYATAVLFTPIGVSIAQSLGVDPFLFVIAVIFGANCCFATPLGYQTNLLVMAPGHYRFADFLRVGTPMILVIWLFFTAMMWFYFGLGI
ncbi:di/tricarboxylate transporter [Rhodothalassium salexigens DSM 2132]|uniref:Di/tricarboxylate transporter n=1 Tax=Rhodothalassium salexigens DSM 2132 TaxID=1188247 RepID=A0A4R2PRJ5_RHOSA|nr:SLC13 family permease [Rhodothalassium salexigens]MBB4210286.1 di/tricarboxylate transporter [Rhodothalassium salexigens DSM 2132]MBK1639195.1 SLC13 family permease [Rhodothalassium salexigens DSM 2132]TCP38450.1 di/tricarboxylate transporter [Rhodothalassium salexigens DSM 2132]